MLSAKPISLTSPRLAISCLFAFARTRAAWGRVACIPIFHFAVKRNYAVADIREALKGA